MFYEEGGIKNLLNCKKCSLRLDSEPKIMPCGVSICSKCVESSIQIFNEKFKCPICLKDHVMPTEGFVINQALSCFLAIDPIQVSRSKAANLLKKSLNGIQKKMKEILQAKNSSSDLVKSHCIKLKNSVQLASEETIMQINEYNKELIKKIDQYQNECLDSFEINEKLTSELNSTLDELKLFEDKWNQYLYKPQLDDDILAQVNERAVNLINKAMQEKSKLDDLIFCGYKLAFKRNDSCQWPKFGLLTSESFVNLNSSILSDFKMLELLTLCRFELNQQWNLIYRASQDGFEASKFHSKCDTLSNTFIIIKSTNDFVFGGYTEQNWSGNGFKNDSNAFIFSFVNKDSKPFVIKCEDGCYGGNYPAIFSGKKFGPRFGQTDICICDRSDSVCESYSNIGGSFKHPEFTRSTNVNRSHLAGSFNFKTLEIEVYTKLNILSKPSYFRETTSSPIKQRNFFDQKILENSLITVSANHSTLSINNSVNSKRFQYSFQSINQNQTIEESHITLNKSGDLIRDQDSICSINQNQTIPNNHSFCNELLLDMTKDQDQTNQDDHFSAINQTVSRFIDQNSVWSGKNESRILEHSC